MEVPANNVVRDQASWTIRVQTEQKRARDFKEEWGFLVSHETRTLSRSVSPVKYHKGLGWTVKEIRVPEKKGPRDSVLPEISSSRLSENPLRPKTALESVVMSNMLQSQRLEKTNPFFIPSSKTYGSRLTLEQARARDSITATTTISSTIRQISSGASTREVSSSLLSSSNGWSDRIHLRGIKVYGYHGVIPAENVIGQTFEVDATVFCSTKKAGISDDLNATISYADVHRVIENIMTGPSKQLLECLAETICQSVLQQHALASEVQVYVRKLCIPGVPAVVQSVGVEIRRSRSDYEKL